MAVPRRSLARQYGSSSFTQALQTPPRQPSWQHFPKDDTRGPVKKEPRGTRITQAAGRHSTRQSEEPPDAKKQPPRRSNTDPRARQALANAARDKLFRRGRLPRFWCAIKSAESIAGNGCRMNLQHVAPVRCSRGFHLSAGTRAAAASTRKCWAFDTGVPYHFA